jgi:NAD(P)H-dependent FMN reductase
MSGAIKNFLDYFWEDFAGKTFGYMVASHEKGLTVADQMRTAIRQCYVWSVPYNISIMEKKTLIQRERDHKFCISKQDKNTCTRSICLWQIDKESISDRCRK